MFVSSNIGEIVLLQRLGRDVRLYRRDLLSKISNGTSPYLPESVARTSRMNKQTSHRSNWFIFITRSYPIKAC
jgi:hypothetical protein